MRNIVKSANTLTRNPKSFKQPEIIQESAVPKDIKDQFVADLESVLSVKILGKALSNLKESLGDALDKNIYVAMVNDIKKALAETKSEIITVVDAVNAIDTDLLPKNQDKEDAAGIEVPEEEPEAGTEPEEKDAEGNTEFES